MTWKHWKTVILIQIQKKHLWLDASFDWIKCLKILSTLEWCSKSQNFQSRRHIFSQIRHNFHQKMTPFLAKRYHFSQKRHFWPKGIFLVKKISFSVKKVPISVKNDREDCLADDLTQTDVQKITSSQVNSKLELEWKKPHASSGQPHRIKKR